MRKILQDLLHAGLGVGVITKEHVEKIFNELKKKGEVYEKDRDFFISNTLEKLEKKGKEVSEKIRDTVRDTVQPAGKKIDELSKKIDDLVKEIEELKKKKG
jgi:polyhydroxyalkanoate synthesis regulator phasin